MDRKKPEAVTEIKKKKGRNTQYISDTAYVSCPT